MKDDGTSYDVDDDITLINNGLSYLIERLSYQVNEKEIEGYSIVGVVTHMKGLITYPSYYNEETLFLWNNDGSKGMNSTGLKFARQLYFKDITQIISVLFFH